MFKSVKASSVEGYINAPPIERKEIIDKRRVYRREAQRQTGQSQCGQELYSL